MSFEWLSFKWGYWARSRAPFTQSTKSNTVTGMSSVVGWPPSTTAQQPSRCSSQSRSFCRDYKKFYPMYITGNMKWLGEKTRNTAKCKEKRCVPKSAGWGGKKTGMSLVLARSGVTCAHWSPIATPTPAATELQPGAATWTATLAPSQAGAIVPAAKQSRNGRIKKHRWCMQKSESVITPRLAHRRKAWKKRREKKNMEETSIFGVTNC